MPFDIPTASTSLAQTAEAIQALVESLTPEAARWKPDAEQWSILEIVNHLVDEETQDFRARLDRILHEPGSDFAPIDPQGAVREGNYAARDLADSVGRFMEERGRSLGWLGALEEPDLDRTGSHPTFGAISGRQMLASWVAHDLHHLRQITRRRYEYLAACVAPTSLDYAGDW